MMNASFNHYHNLPFCSNECTGALLGGEQLLLKKKRSHRPRGCRGGGSRRARKAARELQRTDDSVQPQYLGKLRTQSKLYCIQEGLPSLETLSYSGSEDESIVPQFDTTSMQRSGKVESEYEILPQMQSAKGPVEHDLITHWGVQGPTPIQFPLGSQSTFDILPTLPIMEKAKTFEDEKAQQQLLNTLPPLPLSTGTMAMTPYSSLSYHNSNHNVANPKHKVSSYNVVDVASKDPLYSIETRIASTHINATTGSSTTYHNFESHDIHHVHNHNNSINKLQPIPPHSDFYQCQRIEKQRQMLAGGGSLFLTSPRSFLTGCRNGATSSFK